MGIDELSVNTGAIPLLKKVIRSMSREDAVHDVKEIMKLSTAAEVRDFIMQRMEILMPGIKERDFYIKFSLSNSH